MDPATLLFLNENELLSGVEDPERVYLERILPGKLAVREASLGRRTVLTDREIRITLNKL